MSGKVSQLTVLIHTLTDQVAGKPPIPGIDEKSGTPVHLHTIVFCEKATSGGKTGVRLFMTDSEGKLYEAVCTANIFDGMLSALKGTREKFGDVE
jgi:hypothetical protein